MFVFKLLQRHEIDDGWWNEMNQQSSGGSIQQSTAFLDEVMHNWRAVIAIDAGIVKAALPIPDQRKFGIRYGLQPSFVQHFSILDYGINIEQNMNEIAKGFIQILSREFHYFVLRLRTEDVLPAGENNHFIYLRPRFNYIKKIYLDWSENLKSFSTSITNHMHKALKNGIEIKVSKSVAGLQELMERQRFISFGEQETFCKLLKNKNICKSLFILEARDKKDKLYAAGLFAIYKNRMDFLISANEPGLRHLGANSLLIAEAIRFAAEMGLEEFNFEGSMLPGPRKYFMGFRPEAELYWEVRGGGSGIPGFTRLCDFFRSWKSTGYSISPYNP